MGFRASRAKDLADSTDGATADKGHARSTIVWKIIGESANSLPNVVGGIALEALFAFHPVGLEVGQHMLEIAIRKVQHSRPLLRCWSGRSSLSKAASSAALSTDTLIVDEA
jgi:hypothetical protein